MKTLREQGIFGLKVLRNGIILSGLYFVSVWAGTELSYENMKPLVIFFLAYLFTELARFYKLQGAPIAKNKKGKILISPMIY